ncbi:GDSL-type esterase/lipase family protein [Acidobacteriota bacterium]
MNRKTRIISALPIVLFLLASCGPSGKTGTAPLPALRIITFGDSTTAERSTIKKVYSTWLVEELPKFGLNVEVINYGIPGNTTSDARKRFQRDVMDQKPELVIIQFGLNDSAIDVSQGSRDPRLPQETYTENLKSMVGELKQAGKKVILMTQNPMYWTPKLKEIYGSPPFDVEDPTGLNILNSKYAQTVRDISIEFKVPLIDVYRLFSSSLDSDEEEAASLLLDGIHPNDRGHEIISAKLIDEIRALFPVYAAEQPYLGRTPMSRGYSIPLLDLADDKHRQVIVDREEGQYLGHPTTVLLEDGRTIITVYPKGHGRGAIVMKRSYDAGLTWTNRLPTPKTWETSLEVPTIHRVIDSEGTKRLILFSGLYPIRLAVSEDDGTSWSELSPIGEFGGIVTMAAVVQLKNGDYMALFHDDGRFLRKDQRRENPPVFRVYKTLSSDGGLHWGPPVVIADHPTAHLCEPGIVRSPDGNQMAMLLRENSRKYNSFVSFSNDEGWSWSIPKELPGALTGDRHTGRYAPDGRLFITFRDRTHESLTQGDWVGWVGTYEDIRNGREGQYRVRLMDNTKGADTAYPGLELLPDGTFVTTTYGHWVEGEEPFIMSVSLKLEELDTLAKITGREDKE